MSWYLQLFITAPLLSLRQFKAAAAFVLGDQTWKDSNAGTDRVLCAEAGLAATAIIATQSPRTSDVAFSFIIVPLVVCMFPELGLGFRFGVLADCRAR